MEALLNAEAGKGVPPTRELGPVVHCWDEVNATN